MTQTYGVDFGTSCSSIAIRDGAGGLISVPLDGGHFTMPSSVCRTAAGELLVGATAEHWRVGQWGGYRRFVKQDVGRHGPFSLAGVPTEVVDMVAAILSHLRTQALGLDPTPPDRVVLTVPAAWESNRVDVLISAATKAGFDPQRLRVELEPAAALAYVFTDQALTEDKTVLVYDLGGGTFDCAVAHGRSGAFEIRPHYGALDLVGGRLFDRAIWEIIEEQYPDRVARLYEPGGDSLALSDRLSFDATCEQIKIWLSEHGEYSRAVPELRLDALKVTREQFEARIAVALDETFDTCLSVLDEIGITWEDVDIIAPVGGSSRIPAVVTMLQRRTQRKVIGTSDPELAVARGAALLAANLEPVSVVPAPREALAPQLAANPWPGRQLEAGPSWPGPSTVDILEVLPGRGPARHRRGFGAASATPDADHRTGRGADRWATSAAADGWPSAGPSAGPTPAACPARCATGSSHAATRSPAGPASPFSWSPRWLRSRPSSPTPRPAGWRSPWRSC